MSDSHSPDGPVGHSHIHDHSHDHGNEEHTHPPSDLELRVKALESLLVEKGLVDPSAMAAE